MLKKQWHQHNLSRSDFSKLELPKEKSWSNDRSGRPEKVFLKISQNLQKNTCVVSFFSKIVDL